MDMRSCADTPGATTSSMAPNNSVSRSNRDFSMVPPLILPERPTIETPQRDAVPSGLPHDIHFLPIARSIALTWHRPMRLAVLLSMYEHYYRVHMGYFWQFCEEAKPLARSLRSYEQRHPLRTEHSQLPRGAGPQLQTHRSTPPFPSRRPVMSRQLPIHASDLLEFLAIPGKCATFWPVAAFT